MDRKLIFLFVLAFLLQSCKKSGVVEIPLNKDWYFYAPLQGKWLSAEIPGCIHTDLMAHGIIPDINYGNNEKAIQWVGEKEWTYRCRFNLPKGVLQKEHIFLKFMGLDTYGEVYLNGKLLGEFDNMFIPWSYEITGLVRQMKNEILIHFSSAVVTVDSMAESRLPFILPSSSRTYARKAAYQFGWDWGPKAVTMGIWKGVKILAFNQRKEKEEEAKDRNLHLVTEKDDYGISFYFAKADGSKIYIKGANYIPQDIFPTRVDSSDYRQLFKRVKQAGINMLRVWGGGIYESDYFYELADKYGIYIWQDFMFANTMIPGDSSFFANVKKEILYQVSRLKKFDCIALWCGNNEIDEAWHNWGWQESFHLSTGDSAEIWHDYVRLFRDSIPHWIKLAGGTADYISTSPHYGWGDQRSYTQYDSHYWGIWWGMKDIEVFEEKTGRFVSEYGMQALPLLRDIKKYWGNDLGGINDSIVQDRQKANNGFIKLNHYLTRYFIAEENLKDLSLADYSYLSQCMQYYALKNSSLIHLSKKPANSGTMVWQLNNTWPGISWSLLSYEDYSPYAGWYAIRNTYLGINNMSRDSLRPVEVELHNPQINYRLENDTIFLTCSSLALYVRIDIAGYKGALSDNYFDLKPGKTKKITLLDPVDEISIDSISIMSLYEARHPEEYE